MVLSIMHSRILFNINTIQNSTVSLDIQKMFRNRETFTVDEKSLVKGAEANGDRYRCSAI